MKKVFTKMYWALLLLTVCAAGTARAQDTKLVEANNEGATAMCRDASGNVFVLRDAGTFNESGALTANGAVDEYNSSGTKIGTIITNTGEYRDANEGDPSLALGIAVDASDNIYVTTYNDFEISIPGSIVKYFAPSYSTSTTLLTGANSTNYGYFGSLAMDSGGNLYAFAVKDANNTNLNVLIKLPGASSVTQGNSISQSSVVLIDGTTFANNENVAFGDGSTTFDNDNGNYAPYTALAVDKNNNIFIASAWAYYGPGGNFVGYQGGNLYEYTPASTSTGYSTANLLKSSVYCSSIGCDPNGDVFGTVVTNPGSDIHTFNIVNWGVGATGTAQSISSGTTIKFEDLYPSGLAAVSATNVFMVNGNDGGTNDGDVYELIGVPTSPASGFSTSNITETGATFSWTTNGGGANRAVFVALSTASPLSLTNSTTYTPSTTFMSGTQASSGWYCVYNSTTSSLPLNITGLAAAKTYQVMVVEYNGGAGPPAYQNYETGATVTTFSTPAAPTLTASGGTDSYAIGGTATTVDAGITAMAGQTNLSTATIQVSTNFVTGDALNFTNQNGITGSFSGSTLTLSGSSSVANYQTALRSITFTSTSSTASTRTISFLVGDGTANSSTVTKNITVTSSTTISSLTAVTGTTTNAASVQYTATFAASVSGLSTADFTLNTSGVSGAGVSGVSGSGTSWTVTVNTGSGSGTIQLAMNSSSGVTPSVSNATAGSPFTGSTYTIDKTAPTVSSITAASPSNASPTNATSVTYTVTFSEPVLNVSLTNFTVTKSGTTGSPTNLSGSGSTYTVTVSGITGSGTLRLDLNANGTGITDVTGNVISGGFTTGSVYTIDQTPPTVSSVGVPADGTYKAGQTLTFTANFSEAVTVSTSGGTPYIPVTIGSSVVHALYTSGSGGTALTFVYTVVNGDNDSDGIAVGSAITLNGGTITDAAANSATLTLNSVASTTGVLVDAQAPTVASIVLAGANPTNATTVSYTVTFSESVNNVAQSNFTLTTTSGNAAGTISAITGSGATYTVTVTGVSGNGGLRLDLNSGTTISDQAGNVIASGYTGGQTYTIDTTPATLTSGSYFSNNGFSSQYAKVGDNVTLSVGYNEQLQSAVMTIDGNTVPVSFSNNNQNFTGVYTMTSSDTEGNVPWTISATDLAGNVRSYTNNDFGTVLIFDKTPPAITISAPSQATANSAGTVTYTVTYSDANFNFSTLSTGDITLNTTNTANATVSLSGSGTQYTVSISGITGAGTIGFSIGANTAQDIPGNLALASSPSATFTIDNTPPTAQTLTYSSNNPNSQLVAKVGDVITLDFTASETINAPSVSIAGQSVTASNVSGNEWSASYTMTSGDTEGRVPFFLSFTDLAGNPQPGVPYNDVAAGDDIEFDMTAPTATIGAPSLTQVTSGSATAVTYTVTYADANFNTSSLTSSGISLNTTGTATASIGVTGSGTSYTVTLSNITGLGTIGINVAGGNAFDNAGNTDAGAGPSATFNVLSGDATLSSLALSNGSLSPGFTSTTTGYTAAVGYGLASINITPTTNFSGATITINGTTAPSGRATSVPLSVGSNGVTITVTAADGSTQKTYTVAITEAQSYNDNLASVKTSAGFAQGTTVPSTLTESVINSVTSLTVTPAVADPTATVTVNNVAVTSGNASGPITLNVGPNTITIVVTAQDTKTKTYTLTVTRAPSASDNLSNLVVSSGTLSPAFGTATNYLDYVANGVPFSITPTTADNTATLTINGTTASSGVATSVPLTVGNNTITIVVTAQNTTSTKTYTVVVNEARSPNSTLFSLTTSAGFSQGQTVPTTLAESVPNATGSITVTPTMADNTATVTVNGTAVTSGSASNAINLSVGANTITIVGTAQNGNITTYTLTVTRAASSLLTNIAATAGSLNPAFASATTSYAIYAPNGTTSTTITPTAADPNATITVNGTTVPSGTASQPIALAVGNATETIVVTAADNSTSTTYIVGINVARAPNSTLLSLTTSAGLSQGQTVPTTLTENVPYSTSLITVTPTLVDNTGSVTVANMSVISGTATNPLALNVGSNIITIVGTAPNGSTTTYTLTVTRAASATLSNLTLSAGTLSPAFASGTTAYSAAVGNGASSITLTPTSTGAGAVIKVNGSTVTSGSASQAIPLTVGNTSITIAVTAADNSSTITYNVGVNRARSSEDRLTSYKTSAGLAKGIPVATTLTESVVNATSTITITPTAMDATATITVNNQAVTSGTASQVIALNVGSNTITTVVTAQTGVSLTYTLTVTRAMGSLNTVYQPIGVTKPDGEVQLSDDGINVHQGLSPNGDGINDFLQIDNISQYPDNNLKIMNRNGQLVYEAKGYDNATKAFDGHSNKNGQMQLPGTYFYSLDYTIDGVTKHKTGFLVLKY